MKLCNIGGVLGLFYVILCSYCVILVVFLRLSVSLFYHFHHFCSLFHHFLHFFTPFSALFSPSNLFSAVRNAVKFIGLREELVVRTSTRLEKATLNGTFDETKDMFAQSIKARAAVAAAAAREASRDQLASTLLSNRTMPESEQAMARVEVIMDEVEVNVAQRQFNDATAAVLRGTNIYGKVLCHGCLGCHVCYHVWHVWFHV